MCMGSTTSGRVEENNFYLLLIGRDTLCFCRIMSPNGKVNYFHLTKSYIGFRGDYQFDSFTVLLLPALTQE